LITNYALSSPKDPGETEGKRKDYSVINYASVKKDAFHLRHRNCSMRGNNKICRYTIENDGMVG